MRAGGRRRPRKRATSSRDARLHARRPGRPRAQRRPGPRPALGPHRGVARRGPFHRARSPSRSSRACRATTPATGRPPRSSSTSWPTATRTAATAPPRTSTSASPRVLLGALPHGHRGRRRALHGGLQRRQRHARAPCTRCSRIAMTEWGLDGIICTDGGGLAHLVTTTSPFPDLPDAAAACVKAGINHSSTDYEDRSPRPLSRGPADRGRHRPGPRGHLPRDDPARPARPAGEGALRHGSAEGDRNLGPATTRARSRERSREVHRAAEELDGLLPLDRTALKSDRGRRPARGRGAPRLVQRHAAYAVTPLEGIGPVRRRTWRCSMPRQRERRGDTLQRCRPTSPSSCVGNHPVGDAGWDRCAVPSDGKEAVDRKAITLEQEELIRSCRGEPRTVVVLLIELPYRAPTGRRRTRPRSCT